MSQRGQKRKREDKPEDDADFVVGAEEEDEEVDENDEPQGEEATKEISGTFISNVRVLMFLCVAAATCMCMQWMCLYSQW